MSQWEEIFETTPHLEMSAFMDVNFQPLVDSLENRIEEELALDAEAIEEEEIPFDPATTILNGHLLPVALGGKVKNQLIGVPLGEISPKYKKKDVSIWVIFACRGYSLIH